MEKEDKRNNTVTFGGISRKTVYKGMNNSSFVASFSGKILKSRYLFNTFTDFHQSSSPYFGHVVNYKISRNMEKPLYIKPICFLLVYDHN